MEKNLFQAHVNPDCFQRALKEIAGFLPAGEAFFWAAPDSPFQPRRWWSSSGSQAGEGLAEELPSLLPLLRKRGSLLSYRLDEEDELALGDRAMLRARGVESLMLLPVERRDGALVGVLGAANLRQRWATDEPLRQVALSFSVTAEQYESYRRLDRMSRVDEMTGLMNRNSYHDAMEALRREPPRTLACVYMDANGLHEINNRLGHQAGDEMLIQTARALQACFPTDRLYRIGGDEFIALCADKERQKVWQSVERTQQILHEKGYSLSVGVEWRAGRADPGEVVERAEAAMRDDKRRYYDGPERAHQVRLLDEKTARMVSEKRDMEAFLSILEPQFKGVYFVDLNRDSIRHLFIPSYFVELLQEEDGRFSKGLRLYARQMVKAEYQARFEQLCDYSALERALDAGEAPKLRYQKTDESWLKLQIVRLSDGAGQARETVWIFTELQENGAP